MTVPSDNMSSAASAVVVPLGWDSRHFGISVGRLEGAPDDALLEQLLSDARAGGCDVVYWFAEERRLIPVGLLSQFGGKVVCRRVTYLRDIATGSVAVSIGARRSSDMSSPIVALQRGPAGQRLLDLAVDAGAHSRFQVDRRFSPHKFRELYEIWMTRSALGEIADAVFVAIDSNGDTAGVITVAAKQSETAQVLLESTDARPLTPSPSPMRGEGRETDVFAASPNCVDANVAKPAQAEIGLLAVGAEYRGRGLGTALLQAVDEWAVGRGLSSVSVVTQLENEAACRLYERAGFRVDRIDQVCHFWLQWEADSGTKGPR